MSKHSSWELPLDTDKRTLEFILGNLGGVETKPENFIEGRTYVVQLNNRGDLQVFRYSPHGSKVVEATIRFNGSAQWRGELETSAPLRIEHGFPIYQVRHDYALSQKAKELLGN